MERQRREQLRALSRRGKGVGLWPWFRPSLGRGLFRPIATDRCILRLAARRDGVVYGREAGRPSIAQWMLNFPSPFPAALVERRIEESWANLMADRSLSLVAIERTSGQLIGGVALNNIKALPHPELAYWVRMSRWREGFGAEICQALIDHAFAVRGESRLFASVLSGNEPSAALLARLGFNPDGVETLLAEPYAPIVGLTLEDVIDLQRQTGTPLVEVSLNRWALNRDQWCSSRP